MKTEFQTIGVVGAGAWGTALAQTMRLAGRDVRLWAREDETVNAINGTRENTVFLPGVPLADGIAATGDITALANCDALFVVTPVQHTRSVMAGLADQLSPETPLVLCSKGLEQKTGSLLSQVVAETIPQAPIAILSGPSFAIETARGLPTAVTLASKNEALGEALSRAIGHRALRPYWSGDVPGAQIGGALKNVLAIAAGVVSGMGLGQNAHAALVTRGFTEMVRFGTAFNGQVETLAGLSGLGDLLLTCGSPTSRNMSLGHALGAGQSLEDILAARNSVSEGVYTAGAVVTIAREREIDMPISEAVADVVAGRLPVDDAVDRLLSRPLRSESLV